MAQLYTLIPRPIGEFAGLDALTRYAFGMIYDRWKLSEKNKDKFTDRYGIYCTFSRKAMAAEMGVSLPTLRKCMDQLRDRDLIVMRVDARGDCYRYYFLERVHAYFYDNWAASLGVYDDEGLAK